MAYISDPQERDIETLLRLVPLDGKTVLDIGCGEGRMSRRMARTAASVLGVDPDVEAIDRAREISPDGLDDGCRFLAADVVTLQSPAAGFDVVVFSRSL